MTKILVIEDEELIRDEVLDWLQFEGYEAIGAVDGRLGLTAAEEHLPDLIICDIRMPKMDGYTVLLEVRANPRLSHIPFIFLTANGARESFRKGMDLGADDYLTKPFTHSEVMNAIQSRLEKQLQTQQASLEQIAILEQSLAEAKDKHLLKARLVGVFSHEFRNPLSVILINAQLIEHYGPNMSAESRTARVQQISTATQQLNRMLEDMMLTAKIESGYFVYKPQATEVAALVESIVYEFREAQGRRHDIQLALAALETIDIDVTLLRQIVTNLISNAVKYSPEQTAVKVAVRSTADWLEITVQDSGIGIPEADLPNLFTPFHRAGNARNIQGTGLGLSIVKQAIELCKGQISVQSKEGLGSTFIVMLPYLRSEPEPLK